jgi:hypothetical protein
MCVGFLNNFQFRQASDSGGGLCRNGTAMRMFGDYENEFIKL